MRRGNHGLASLGLVLLLVAGCGGTTPATPSPGLTTPSPSVLGPTASPVASASPGVPQKDMVVVTVSDRLRVRSEPRVDDSVAYEPLLPLGTELFVLDGPVSGNGYTWYKVAPVSFAGLDGPGFGWIASADKNGDPWIAPATGPTADLGIAMAPVVREAAGPADARRAAAAINAFGVALHRALLVDPALELSDKNLVFSPTSIEIALAMARAGAKGDTATEMDAVLGAADWDALAAGLNSLDQTLASRDARWTDSEGAKELTLRLANAPFAQRGWTIEPAYLDAIASAFGASLRLVDYTGDLAAARQAINGWVSDRTADRIPELLSPTDLTPNSRLTLVNAIYLKAQWAVWFQENLTRPAPFTRLDGSRVDVPTMERWGGNELPYATGSGWQATELRYLGPTGPSSLAMLLVRPDDLRAFETGLTAAKLDAITAAIATERQRQQDGIDCPGVPPDQQDAGCYPYALTVYMPKFSTETRAKLNDVLTALGMPIAFDPARADFSGINPRDPVHIGFVIHQANIDVDEKGTTAAAATAVGMDVGGGPTAAKEVTLRLDRPFLFFVRDIETGAVLFMGRIVDPSDVRGD